MKPVRYVLMNPTGNLTALVISPVQPRERPAVTAALLPRCEQVGYLGVPKTAGSRLFLRMMGGEFCGNASMAAAAFLCRETGLSAGQEMEMRLDVSGARSPVPCRIRTLGADLWEGSVTMPPVREIAETELAGERLILVRLEGITHLIRQGEPMEQGRAESLLRRASEILPGPALGLLQWDADENRMQPLVFVRESDSMVWETGCGSGSTAIGAWQALLRREPVCETDVLQPGGCLRVRTELKNGFPDRVFISGKVAFVEEGVL